MRIHWLFPLIVAAWASGAEVPSAPVPKGVMELLSDETVITVGGRVRLDVRYAWPDGSFKADNVPVGDEADTTREGHLDAFVRGSRLWIKSRTPTPYGVARTLVEVDFFGNAGSESDNLNGHGVRLRHFYAGVGNWTFGQTYSTFTTFVNPDTIAIPVADTAARQPLVRYSVETDRIGYDVAAELPETTLLRSDGSFVEPKTDRIPELMARARFYPSWGEAAAALMLRDIRDDRDGSHGALGWGVNASFKLRFGSRDDLRAGFVYGEGVGRYVGYNAYTAGMIEPDGSIDLRPVYALHAALRHWWNPQWRSSLVYSGCGTTLGESAPPDASEQVYALYANLIFTPVKHLLLGVEAAAGEHETHDGASGEKYTLRFRARLDF